MAQEEQEIVDEPQPNSSGGVRDNLNFKVIIMRQIDRCGFSLSKLPHEYQNENLSQPLGCSFDDIRRSFYDGVQLLEALLEPYLDDQYRARYAILEGSYNETKDAAAFYFKRFSNAVALCARIGLLLENTGTGEI